MRLKHIRCKAIYLLECDSLCSFSKKVSAICSILSSTASVILFAAFQSGTEIRSSSLIVTLQIQFTRADLFFSINYLFQTDMIEKIILQSKKFDKKQINRQFRPRARSTTIKLSINISIPKILRIIVRDSSKILCGCVIFCPENQKKTLFWLSNKYSIHL